MLQYFLQWFLPFKEELVIHENPYMKISHRFVALRRIFPSKQFYSGLHPIVLTMLTASSNNARRVVACMAGFAIYLSISAVRNVWENPSPINRAVNSVQGSNLHDTLDVQKS